MRCALACLRTQFAMIPKLQSISSSPNRFCTASGRVQPALLALSTPSRSHAACVSQASHDASYSRLRHSLLSPLGCRAGGPAALGWSAVTTARKTHTTFTARRRISTSCQGRDSTTTAAAAAAVAEPTSSHLADTGLLTLTSGAFDMPHPEKVARGGEDAWFIANCQTAVGVADGVGGWAEVKVDAGIYAKMLMRLAREEADLGATSQDTLDPQHLLNVAYQHTDVQGSATACIVTLHPQSGELHAANLGDSGFLLVRDGQIAFQSPPQQHDFNFPYQLGSVGSMSDKPEAAEHFRVPVQPGDTVIVASDGLFDNVFAEECAAIVYQCKLQQATADITAQVLCQYARMRAADRKYPSPFAQAAFQNGFSYMGGKMDDITVVVSYLTPAAKL